MPLKKPIHTFDRKDWFWVLLLTLLLFSVFFIYNNSDYVLPGEQSFATKVEVLEDLILPGQFKPPHEFVFINVGKDLSLVKDEEGGDHVITDRDKLGRFMKILADSNRHKFVFCDIIFDLPSPEDAQFSKNIAGLQRVIFPKHISDSSLGELGLSGYSAYADYFTNTGSFNKFRLLQKNKAKSLPVRMHEQLSHVAYQWKYGWLFCNNSICLQTLVPRFFIRPYQLNVTKSYPYFNLGELLQLVNASSFYQQFLANKFIVIGNFETDVHSTSIGSMPGTLILLNTYLNLHFGRQKLTVAWFFTMFLIFFLINLYLIHGIIETPKMESKNGWWTKVVNSMLVKLFSIGGLCMGILLISDLFFGVQCEVLCIVFFILAINFLLRFSTSK